MSITLVALKIWPSFSAFSLSSDNLCFEQVEEREPIHVQFNSDKFPENARLLNIWEGRSAGKFVEIKWTPGLDSTNPRLIFQFRELRIDIHQMSVHPVKISVFIKPLKIKESSGGRSEDARGPLCCCGWPVFVSSWVISLSLCCDDPESAGTWQCSGQHLEPGHHSSLVTNIKYAQGPAAAEREALQCSGSGHESRRKKTHCEDLCGQA